MTISGVSSTAVPGIVDKAGGLSIRDQMRAKEASFKEKERAALAAAPDDATRGALKKQFTEERAARAQEYAAILCSDPNWKSKCGDGTPGTVLTSFYALMGKKARAYAAHQQRPFRESDLQHVRLNETDIEGLRKQFGDDEIKKAWPLLEKHIVHDGFLTKGAQKFMSSAKFLAYHNAIEAAHDRMERGIESHREKLDEQAAENLRDELRQKEKRTVTDWTARVVVERDQARQEKSTYAVVGGKLVTVSTNKPE